MKEIIRYFANILWKILGTKRLFTKEEYYHYEHRRYQLIEHILHDKESGVTPYKYVDHDIIVSLTTYGKRIHDVAFTIESIMQQSLKANRIVLWLDYSFQNKKLPQSLLKQKERGLEIMFCDDIRSYKKIIPSMKMFRSDAIITLDDDLLYDYDILEHLILAYIDCPQCIQSCRGHEIRFNSKGNVLPYREWVFETEKQGIINNYFFTSGGGTLFPPNCLDDEVFNEEVFMNICKFADDIWLNAMALKKGTIINKIFTRNPRGNDFLLNEGVQDISLRVINTEGEMLNDKQLEAVYSKYNLFKKLK
jgi:hypothetical protein